MVVICDPTCYQLNHGGTLGHHRRSFSSYFGRKPASFSPSLTPSCSWWVEQGSCHGRHGNICSVLFSVSSCPGCSLKCVTNSTILSCSCWASDPDWVKGTSTLSEINERIDVYEYVLKFMIVRTSMSTYSPHVKRYDAYKEITNEFSTPNLSTDQKQNKVFLPYLNNPYW